MFAPRTDCSEDRVGAEALSLVALRAGVLTLPVGTLYVPKQPNLQVPTQHIAPQCPRPKTHDRDRLNLSSKEAV